MHLRTTRQRTARAHGHVVTQACRIAETDDPFIVHRQKFQNRNKEFRVFGPRSQVGLIRAGGAQKDANQIVLAHDPTQRLQRNSFGIFLLHSTQPRPFETLC